VDLKYHDWWQSGGNRPHDGGLPSLQAQLKGPLIGVDEQSMGKRTVGVPIALLSLVSLFLTGCGAEEATAPTFRVTSPTLVTTSTTTPSMLEYLGLPELSSAENEMCQFILSVGMDLDATDEQSRNATIAVEAAAKSRTLSEPLRVRMLRDVDVANVQRFANVLSRFEPATDLIRSIEPGQLTSQEQLESDAIDAELLTEIAADLHTTIETTRPLNPAEQAAHLERTGTEWSDLFTESELDEVRRTLNNSSTGMGREVEAREAMERLDDWSWRHCDAGLTR
jgi:hypothetical protein